MSGNFNTSEYVTENDLKNIVLEYNEKLNHKYHYYCKEDFKILFDISERIGKNGNKIQRLRTKISQLKKSLIPVVDE